MLICTFLVTSEYCLETTQQLEGKLREKASGGAANAKINLGAEQDVYHSVINSCIQLLVQVIIYRVTIQVVPNLPLTSKQKLRLV